jgi:hypothetical protein
MILSREEIDMKGVVVEIDNAKCIVLFNNGHIGSLPKPPNCEVGMVITVNFNRKLMMLPIAAFVVLLAVGIIVWFALRGQGITGMSPEHFCNSPFLRKDIILPLSEYANFDDLFTHLGNPVREFSTEHFDRFYDKRKDDDDDRFYGHSRYVRNGIRGFNYRYYSIISYYTQNQGKVLISEVILNSKEVIYNGNFSIGDDRKKIEEIFSKYITSSGVWTRPSNQYISMHTKKIVKILCFIPYTIVKDTIYNLKNLMIFKRLWKSGLSPFFHLNPRLVFSKSAILKKTYVSPLFRSRMRGTTGCVPLFRRYLCLVLVLLLFLLSPLL